MKKFINVEALEIDVHVQPTFYQFPPVNECKHMPDRSKLILYPASVMQSSVRPLFTNHQVIIIEKSSICPKDVFISASVTFLLLIFTSQQHAQVINNCGAPLLGLAKSTCIIIILL